MTAAFVVDASVALSWCFHDEGTDVTRGLLERMSAETAAVPALWFLEMANALVTAERRGRITASLTAEFAALIAQFDLDVDDHSEHRALTHVLELARTHALSAYDGTYLDLAIRRRLPLATLDARLGAAAAKMGVEVLGSH